MDTFLKFLAAMAAPLTALFHYSQSVAKGEKPDPDYERELAGKLIRAASDEQMHKELGF